MNRRTIARLAAVQALYQMEHSAAGVETVILEFRTHRFDGDVEGVTLANADEEFFADLLRGIIAGQVRVDRSIESALADGWTLARLDATARAILRAAIYELTTRADVPAKAVIDEYVEIAHDFFGEGVEPRFINGALDSIARRVRAEEISHVAPE